MTRSSHHLLTAALVFVLAASPRPVVAQEVVQMLPGTTDADRLGDVMRQLASNPRDVDALIKAADLSMGLGDLSGAAALLARAEKVNPRDGRIKAGMASILVRSERPGEALRYFAQAESYGLDPRRFAADRGLAYDLIGEQDRAQRDYRLALREAPDDETLRRYALSLGISGKQDLALQQLAPLLQKSDRGAWRSRAFIMAMNGDVSGAERIATTMMPRGTAQGLQPFFQRLPTLPAIDRAFAVHFGEVHATPERIADARMTPPLGALAPDPTAPVMLAASPPPVAVAATFKKTKRDRRGKQAKVEMAAANTRRTTPPAVAVAPPVQLASSSVRQAQPVPYRSTAPVAPTPQTAYSAPAPAAPTVQRPAVVPEQTGVATNTVPPVASPTQAPVALARVEPGFTASPSSSVATQTAAQPVGQVQSATPRSANAVAASALPSTTAPTQQAAAGAVRPAPVQVATATPPRAVATSEDSILARIVAGLSIPASELDVAPMRPAPVVTQAAVPVSADAERVLAEAKAKAERDAAAKTLAAEKLEAGKLAADKLAADRKALADKKAADRKVVADKKALAAKKAAAAEKLAADKAAAEEKRIARANPERIWVQVSTGATEGDLPKAWKKAKSKAPTVFGSRGGWTAPWKATNRVLAGPFKTDAEARTFVNQLAKEGVSTFTFTSDAGEVITKLPSK
ncbi:SPOR domain-containing protein [Sphingomonas sp. M1A8_2b]